MSTSKMARWLACSTVVAALASSTTFVRLNEPVWIAVPIGLVVGGIVFLAGTRRR